MIVGCGFPEDEAGNEPRPPGRPARRAAARRCRARPSTGSALRASSRSGWPSTRSRPAKATAFVAGGVESTRQVSGYPESRRGAPPRPLRRRRADRERLHPDGDHRRERRRALERLARRHGPVRAALAGARRRGAGLDGFFDREITPYEGVDARRRAAPRRRRSRSSRRSSRRSCRAARSRRATRAR